MNRTVVMKLRVCGKEYIQGKIICGAIYSVQNRNKLRPRMKLKIFTNLRNFQLITHYMNQLSILKNQMRDFFSTTQISLRKKYLATVTLIRKIIFYSQKRRLLSTNRRGHLGILSFPFHFFLHETFPSFILPRKKCNNFGNSARARKKNDLEKSYVMKETCQNSCKTQTYEYL